MIFFFFLFPFPFYYFTILIFSSPLSHNNHFIQLTSIHPMFPHCLFLLTFWLLQKQHPLYQPTTPRSHIINPSNVLSFSPLDNSIWKKKEIWFSNSKSNMVIWNISAFQNMEIFLRWWISLIKLFWTPIFYSPIFLPATHNSFPCSFPLSASDFYFYS